MQLGQYFEIAFVIYTTLMIIYIYFLNFLRIMIIETLKKKHREYFKTKIKPIIKWYNWLPLNKALAKGTLNLLRDDKIIKYAKIFKKYYPALKPLVITWTISYLILMIFFWI